jgi:hypothetical protein
LISCQKDFFRRNKKIDLWTFSRFKSLKNQSFYQFSIEIDKKNLRMGHLYLDIVAYTHGLLEEGEGRNHRD